MKLKTLLIGGLGLAFGVLAMRRLMAGASEYTPQTSESGQSTLEIISAPLGAEAYNKWGTPYPELQPRADVAVPADGVPPLYDANGNFNYAASNLFYGGAAAYGMANPG